LAAREVEAGDDAERLGGDVHADAGGDEPADEEERRPTCGCVSGTDPVVRRKP
jgi:hypothetical protein